MNSAIRSEITRLLRDRLGGYWKIDEITEDDGEYYPFIPHIRATLWRYAVVVRICSEVHDEPKNLTVYVDSIKSRLKVCTSPEEAVDAVLQILKED